MEKDIKFTKIETRNPTTFAFELQIEKLGSAVYSGGRLARTAINGLMKTTIRFTFEKCATVFDVFSALKDKQ